MAIYAQLVGSAWLDLDETVRRFHDDRINVSGCFRVGHGTSLLARCLVKLLRLPAAGEAVPVRLTVTPRGTGEEWLRTFAGRPMVTFQSPGPKGLLAERLGPWEHFFRLSVSAGALVYEPAGIRLGLGFVRLPSRAGSDHPFPPTSAVASIQERFMSSLK